MKTTNFEASYFLCQSVYMVFCHVVARNVGEYGEYGDQNVDDEYGDQYVDKNVSEYDYVHCTIW